MASSLSYDPILTSTKLDIDDSINDAAPLDNFYEEEEEEAPIQNVDTNDEATPVNIGATADREPTEDEQSPLTLNNGMSSPLNNLDTNSNESHGVKEVANKPESDKAATEKAASETTSSSNSRKRKNDDTTSSSQSKRSNTNSTRNNEADSGSSNESEVYFKLLIPSTSAGGVIGRGGEKIAQIQKDSNVKMKMSKASDFYPNTCERVCLIIGSIRAVIKAHEFIVERIQERQQPETIKKCDPEMVERLSQVNERKAYAKLDPLSDELLC